MPRAFLALSSLLAVLTACASELPTDVTPPLDRPQLLETECGPYEPEYQSILIDSVAIFTRSNPQIGCSSRYVEITPANGDAGFSHGSGCTLTTNTTVLVFKIRGCQTGTVLAEVYTNSSKSTHLQTVTLDIE
jgi:hypothetical protein